MQKLDVCVVSFNFTFHQLDELSGFRDFLDTWSEGYSITEGTLQCFKSDLFQIRFTIKANSPDFIPASKISEIAEHIWTEIPIEMNLVTTPRQEEK